MIFLKIFVLIDTLLIELNVLITLEDAESKQMNTRELEAHHDL